MSVLKNRFALVDDVKVLEQQLLAAKDAHDELAGALAQKSRQFGAEIWKSVCAIWKTPEVGEAATRSRRQQLRPSARRVLAARRRARLMRLFNSALFSLPLGEHGITLDEDGQWVRRLS